MLDNKPTYILLNISTLDEVIYLSLIQLTDIVNVLGSDISSVLIKETKPIELLLAVFDNYGACISYKKHLITSGIPIKIVMKRIYYSVALLLKELSISSTL